MSTRPSSRPRPDAQRVLAEQVFAGGRSKPFAEHTADEVQSRARTVGGLDPDAVA